MPHKSIDKLGLVLDEWIERTDDACLYEVLIEAVVARHRAIHAGARKHADTNGALEAGDATMLQIEAGRYESAAACTRAATAVRKYTQAYDRSAQRSQKSCA